MSFSFRPIFTELNSSETPVPVVYCFETNYLRDLDQLEKKEEDKGLFIIAIITTALLTFWGTLYYAKNILEENRL